MTIQSAARFLLAVSMLTIAVGDSMSLLHAQQTLPSATWPLYRDDALPGMIGSSQHFRRPQTFGYFQPVEIQGPEGVVVSLASEGMFDEAQPAPRRAALLVGTPYRVRLGGIPFQDGEELFPSIELIDRLYPPAEREHRFPIPIVLDEDDIAAALRGDLVTRVIYLEDAEIAEPISHGDGIQRVLDVRGAEDALRFADQLGRPVAIIRLGSRTPSQTAASDHSEFLFGCPPWFPVKEYYRSESASQITAAPSSGGRSVELGVPVHSRSSEGTAPVSRPNSARVPSRIGG